MKIDAQGLAYDLLQAATNIEARDILESLELWDEENWHDYGDTKANNSTVSNQQADPVPALAEKIINSIDAILMRDCQIKKTPLIGDEPPKNMHEAILRFKGWNTPIYKWSIGELRKASQELVLVFSGEQRSPTIDIIDQGEGQDPTRFDKTFVSLNEVNKTTIPFVQGKYNMGSTGVLSFLDDPPLQLIISRRHPDIETDANWGLTLVKAAYKVDVRQWVWVYLAPNSKILQWNVDSMKIIPSQDQDKNYLQFNKNLRGGTFIRLWNYQASTGRVFGKGGQDSWMRKLEAFLPKIIIPARVYDFRKSITTGTSTHRSGYLIGAFNRTRTKTLVNDDEDHKADSPIFTNEILFHGHTISIEAHFPLKLNTDGTISQDTIIYTSDNRSPYQAGYGPLFYLVNGQTHSFETGTFFNRKEMTKLRELQYGIVIYVDLTELIEDGTKDSKEIGNIVMASRDRLRSSNVAEDLKRELARTIGENEALQLLVLRIQEIKRRGSLEIPLDQQDDWEEYMKYLQLSGPGIMDDEADDEFRIETQKEYPDKWELVRPMIKKGKAVLNSSIIGSPYVEFKTDAVPDYFDRDYNPGQILIHYKDQNDTTHPVRPNIDWDRGLFRLRLPIPDDLEPNTEYQYWSSVTDPRRKRDNKEPFRDEWIIHWQEPDTGDGPSPRPVYPPTTKQLSLPKRILIDKRDWSKHNFDQTTGSGVDQTDNYISAIYINIDNVFYKNAFKQAKGEKQQEALKRYYIFTISTYTMSIWEQYNKNLRMTDPNSEDSPLVLTRNRSKAISKCAAFLALQYAQEFTED